MSLLIATALAALLAAGPPKTPPPKVGGTEVSPPPAWIDGSGRAMWMAFGSYCWSANGQAACVDMIPPATRTDIATLKVRRDAKVTVHLRFKPRAANVTLRGRPLHTVTSGTTITWRARGGGLLSLDVKATGGSASYLARIRVTP